MKVLIVSDTHGNLPIQLEDFDVDSIIHAGDIGDFSFLAKFDNFAKSKNFFAVSGNMDFTLRNSLPKTVCSKIDNLTFFLTHDLFAFSALNDCEQTQGLKPNFVIFGHTHTPLLEERNGVIFINPGSLGKKGTTGQRSYAILNIEGSDEKQVSLKIFDADSKKAIMSKNYSIKNNLFREI